LSRSLPFSSTQHSGDNYSILNNDDVTDENIAHSDTTDTANISDNNSSSDREEGERLTEDIHLRTQEGDSIENFDGSLQDELRTEQIGRAEGELLKKETENLNQLIEQQKQQQQRQHLEQQEYPFSVENKLADVTDPICREVKSETNRNMRENLALDSLVKRESSSQVDLRRSLYHPDAKSPGSRSLAEELREVGVTNQDAPPCEPRPPNYSSPERIFKVVFVGDSAVGKTCFLHRFCHNRFKPLFNATIGVDFTVKTIRLQNRDVLTPPTKLVKMSSNHLQHPLCISHPLRFRSITKQYFRKADGVILMYDVTSEQSFLHVRNWIDSVKNGVDEACVMCLVGNKVDLFGSDHTHALTFKHGQKLAEEFNMLFFETSAFTGYNVNECMRAVAMRLQQREEDDLQEALKLEMGVQSSRRSWCCM
uniref:RAB44 protein n=1 Tax=Anisakis simplex TaxID=6269 RepID=A0A0M3JV23_ANISI